MNSGRSNTIALSGILAAAAVVVMLLGGLVPMSTYVCPMIVCLLCQIIRLRCGCKMAWTWYAAVSLLALIAGPDMEAALVFAFLGYYPIIKPVIDRSRLRLLWKMLFFNAAIFVLYILLGAIMGVSDSTIEADGAAMLWMLLVLVLGNIVFFLLDVLLTRLSGRLKGGKNNG